MTSLMKIGDQVYINLKYLKYAIVNGDACVLTMDNDVPNKDLFHVNSFNPIKINAEGIQITVSKINFEEAFAKYRLNIV